ncbi:peroxide stress protein YaaA [Kiloniella majae]|uniref:peroxide stress protein YaaA n=1 Tax=Kiloniella majae TaxID=1938558 RepID=UPI000A279922|nr:peroxide stress protein YaaA [Kiloniella majae]
MLAVVSPAKKLDESAAKIDFLTSQPVFENQIQDLLSVAKDLTRADLRNLMSISENLADLNYQRYRNFSFPFTQDNAKVAVDTFKGDTYVGLDAESLSEDELRYAQDHLRILSGLYGVLRPLDLMQPYRLEMGTKLRNPHGEDLYDFWGDQISKELNTQLAGHRDRILVNVASNEYFKAVKKDKLEATVITPVFKEVKDGVAKIISFPAKRARGMMARFIIQGRIDKAVGLKDFTAGGYSYRSDLSNASEFVFTREHGKA